ncbi:DUF4956 domain-containing protein [Oerskovia turbata]|uniref:DUF4956 domain-containing protein n=1 Tax=Oerskovia turbata TaxID=1713 RepID=A0A4Q1KT01_9CELL|nr:DUF4956 domain-containing protein [Oerskovia turbata]RXR25254.1 DUF4956 domain-containing protein [Oerskovia turbata]RXR32805.1 DUF4956 domain-containing protein [Oerskovia turbata]
MTQPPQLALYLVDLVAVLVLTFGLYFPRHRRRDLVVAYLGVNVGVLAVAATLASSTVGAGLGLGLFGVLSIIRLRSTELSQHEVAYYFAALALGLLGGLGTTAGWLGVAGSALILVVMAVADHPRLLRRHRSQVVLLDRAFPDEAGLVAYLEQLLGAHVHSASVQRLDLVNDTTLVDVRFEVAPGGGAASSATDVAAALATPAAPAARVSA